MTNLKKLEKQEWDLATDTWGIIYNVLGDEEDFLDELTIGYGGYIGDCIMEAADYYTPIHYGKIWENVSDIRAWIEEALDEYGLPKNVDLIKIFQQGYYKYYSELAYQNWDQIVWNFTVNYIQENGFEDKLTDDDFEDIENFIKNDIQEFEEVIDFIEDCIYYED